MANCQDLWDLEYNKIQKAHVPCSVLSEGRCWTIKSIIFLHSNSKSTLLLLIVIPEESLHKISYGNKKVKLTALLHNQSDYINWIFSFASWGAMVCVIQGNTLIIIKSSSKYFCCPKIITPDLKISLIFVTEGHHKNSLSWTNEIKY